jgi:hypothetical protein
LIALYAACNLPVLQIAFTPLNGIKNKANCTIDYLVSNFNFIDIYFIKNGSSTIVKFKSKFKSLK